MKYLVSPIVDNSIRQEEYLEFANSCQLVALIAEFVLGYVFLNFGLYTIKRFLFIRGFVELFAFIPSGMLLMSSRTKYFIDHRFCLPIKTIDSNEPSGSLENHIADVTDVLRYHLPGKHSTFLFHPTDVCRSLQSRDQSPNTNTQDD